MLGQRVLLFDLGGGLQQQCVSDILTSIRPGPARPGVHDSFSGSVTAAPCQVFIIVLFVLRCSHPLPRMRWPAFFTLPHARAVIFHSVLSCAFFHPCSFLHFSTLLVPPLFLACLSLFSLPHFLCALQWFFRFFPTIYRLLLFFPSRLASLCFTSFFSFLYILSSLGLKEASLYALPQFSLSTITCLHGMKTRMYVC